MIQQSRILPLQGEYLAEVDLTAMPGGTYAPIWFAWFPAKGFR